MSIELIDDIQNNLDILNYYLNNRLTDSDYEELKNIRDSVFIMVMTKNYDNILKMVKDLIKWTITRHLYLLTTL